MLDPADNSVLPAIPAKRYFTIGEVSELCQVKPHVLRYWEQEFSQLNPVKRRGNRRYYQRHEVELIRTIRSLLYLEGFTISGARQKLESDDDYSEPVTAVSEKPKVSNEVIGGLISELEELTVMLRD
jgi:DNA-binding transcriptional MerR regulator